MTHVTNVTLLPKKISEIDVTHVTHVTLWPTKTNLTKIEPRDPCDQRDPVTQNIQWDLRHPRDPVTHVTLWPT